MFLPDNLFLLLLFCGFVMTKSIQNESDINTVDDNVSKRMETLELSVKNMSRTILQMKKEIDEDRKRPMFFARLSSAITLQTYSIVKFNTIMIDEGDNFNSGDGIFIAPVTGIYMFSWTIQETTSHYAYTDLRVDNVVKASLVVNLSGSEGYNTATRIMFCKVQKGDHVWIQTRGELSSNYFHTVYNSKSSFMGILVK